MNPQALLDQFLGPQATQNMGDKARNLTQGLSTNPAMAGMAGVAAGGILGLLVGNKKARKTVGNLAGGVVGYGGAAALGALAYRAYQNWQANQAAPPERAIANFDARAVPALPPAGSNFLPGTAPGRDGKPFELALVKAMVGAAAADGHIGPDEQQRIFSHVAQLPLDADDKAFIFDALKSPPDANAIASLANGPEQAAELYLASRLALDPSDPKEATYLRELAQSLALPHDLVSHLDMQAATPTRTAA
jgi:uncharacterized membrane protein YebE (DUF533 family)